MRKCAADGTTKRSRVGQGVGRRKHWQDRSIYFEAGRWAVRIKHRKRLVYLGRYDTRREAKKARDRFWAQQLGPDWQQLLDARERRRRGF